MLRKVLKVSMASLLGLATILLASGAFVTADDKEKVPTIKEIMVKGHKGSEAYIGKIKADAKAGKWDEAKEYAKTLAFFGENIGKNKPKKGDAESWEKLSKKYADSTKAALKGVEDKDEKEVNKALGSINCKECHDKHK